MKSKLNTQLIHFLYAMLISVFFVGCKKPQGENIIDTKKGYNIKTIDSCEYIEVDSGFGEY